MAAEKPDLGFQRNRKSISGRPVSEGIAIAPAFLFSSDVVHVQKAEWNGASPEEAVRAVKSALQDVDGDLALLIASFSEDEQEQAKIFAAHREILADDELRQTVFDNIRKERMSAEYAVYEACETFVSLLKSVADETIAMRASDITDVCDRLIRKLRGETKHSLSHLTNDCILVAHDLLPSDTATIDRVHVAGIVTEMGSETSHTAILARSFGIPALVGVKDALSVIRNGETLFLDAGNGELTISPDTEQIILGNQKRKDWQERRTAANSYLEKPLCTTDGERILVGLNIGSDEDDIPKYADFIGLFRTEFLYMNADRLPTEDEQFAAYCRVLQKAGARTVTLRTLDIGGDKTLKYMQLPKEENPFLGKRALRLCFDEPDLFLTQLRAALRASAHGKLQIMFPMVGSIDDIRKAKKLTERAKAELRERNEPFDEDVRLGIMIEIPSIAMVSELAAREVDFASVGTNDLSQYLFAADRMNPELAEYCQLFSPAFLRVLRQIISAFRTANKEVSVCGEMAGDPRAAVLLAGLGLRKSSMNVSAMAGVKAALSHTSVLEAETLAAKAEELPTQAEVIESLARHCL